MQFGSLTELGTDVGRNFGTTELNELSVDEAEEETTTTNVNMSCAREVQVDGSTSVDWSIGCVMTDRICPAVAQYGIDGEQENLGCTPEWTGRGVSMVKCPAVQCLMGREVSTLLSPSSDRLKESTEHTSGLCSDEPQQTAEHCEDIAREVWNDIDGAIEVDGGSSWSRCQRIADGPDSDQDKPREVAENTLGLNSDEPKTAERGHEQEDVGGGRNKVNGWTGTMSSSAWVDIGSDKLQEVAEPEKNITVDERYGLSWVEYMEDERWKSAWVMKVEEAGLAVDTSLNGSCTVEAVLHERAKQGRVFDVTLHSHDEVTRGDMRSLDYKRSDGYSGESSSSLSGEDESTYTSSVFDGSLNSKAVEPETGSEVDISMDSVESVAWEAADNVTASGASEIGARDTRSPEGASEIDVVSPGGASRGDASIGTNEPMRGMLNVQVHEIAEHGRVLSGTRQSHTHSWIECCIERLSCCDELGVLVYDVAGMADGQRYSSNADGTGRMYRCDSKIIASGCDGVVDAREGMDTKSGGGTSVAAGNTDDIWIGNELEYDCSLAVLYNISNGGGRDVEVYDTADVNMLGALVIPIVLVLVWVAKQFACMQEQKKYLWRLNEYEYDVDVLRSKRMNSKLGEHELCSKSMKYSSLRVWEAVREWYSQALRMRRCDADVAQCDLGVLVLSLTLE